MCQKAYNVNTRAPFVSSNMKQSDKETIEIARSIIRDLTFNYSIKELQMSPREICNRLSNLLGQQYDFDNGACR
jgi:hypothetical protein